MAEETDRYTCVLLEAGKAEIETKLPARKVLSRIPLLSVIYPLPAQVVTWTADPGVQVDREAAGSEPWASGNPHHGCSGTTLPFPPDSQIHSRGDAQRGPGWRRRVLSPVGVMGEGWSEATFTFGAQVTRPIPFLI